MSTLKKYPYCSELHTTAEKTWYLFLSSQPQFLHKYTCKMQEEQASAY
jgi:hypothetical protein